MKAFILVLSCSLLCGSFVATAMAQSSKIEREENWQSIYLSGQRIGYSHTIVEPVEQNGKIIVRTTSVSNMTIKRFGQSLVMKQNVTTEETTDGDMLNFLYETANPPAQTTSTTGTVNGTELILVSTVNGKPKETRPSWRSDVKSPTFQDRALRASPLRPGESRSFDVFLPEFNKVAAVKLKAADFEETALLDGKKQRLLKVNMTQSLVPGLVVSEFVDAKGDALKTATSLLGSEMVTYQVSREEALKAVSGAEFDLAVNTLVKVKRISDPYTRPKLRYKVTSKGQTPESFLVADEVQSIKNVADNVAEVTVTAKPIPAKAKIQSVDKEYLEPTQFIQSDDERVKEHANKAVGDATDPAEMTRRMEKYVGETLVKKNFSTAMASAGEVAKSLEGDCTEHSVLLAAMLRAKGIPSRVVVGLVYVDSLSAFGGHMWVEANLEGHWIPLDPTLGRDRLGPIYLKMSESSLSDDGAGAISNFAPLMLVIGQLQIEVLD